MSQAQEITPTSGLLHEAIDLHLHTAPSVFPRYADDLTVASTAHTWGVAGFALKAHEGSSCERATLVNAARPGSRAIGGTVLNQFVGGLNPLAVEVALALGGRIVWLPTIHSANHIHHYGGPTYAVMSSALPPREVESISVLDEQGRLRPEVIEIIDIVRGKGAILATGHIGAREILSVAAAARARGLEKLIVTHPDLDVVGLDEETQAQLARQGAFLELTALNHRPEWGGLSHEAVVARVRNIGAEHFVLASDYGQKGAGDPWQGFATQVARLLQAGLSESDLRRMMRQNPRMLVAE